MNYNKEAIYDEQIAPLMTQIINICESNGLQMVASFALIDEDPNFQDKPMVCTSSTIGDTFNNPALQKALACIYA